MSKTLTHPIKGTRLGTQFININFDVFVRLYKHKDVNDFDITYTFTTNKGKENVHYSFAKKDDMEREFQILEQKLTSF